MNEVISPNGLELNRKTLPSNNPLTPNNLFNLPLFNCKARNLEINLGEDLTPHNENRLGGFMPHIPKRESSSNNDIKLPMNSFYQNQKGMNINYIIIIDNLKDFSPKMANNMLMFSPLFSTRHSFFNPFTPRNLSLNLQEINETRLSGFDDYANLAPKTPKSNATINDSDINNKMDKLIEELRTNISHISTQIISNTSNISQHKIHKPQPDYDSESKPLNLDIDLINDTYVPSNQSNIPASIVPIKVNNANGTRRTTPIAKKLFGELSLSPNSPFIPIIKNKQ